MNRGVIISFADGNGIIVHFQHNNGMLPTYTVMNPQMISYPQCIPIKIRGYGGAGILAEHSILYHESETRAAPVKPEIYG